MEQLLHHQPGIDAVAEADRHVDVLALEVEGLRGDVDPHVRARHRFEEAVEPGHQPFGGDRGRGGDAHLGRVLELADALQRAGQAFQRLRDGGLQDLALPRQLHVAAGALEQRHAHGLLQFLDLVAHRGGRHVQLMRGAGEVQVAGGGVEGLERGQAGNVAQHGRSSNEI